MMHHTPQGIEYLVENGLLQESPEDVARFLYKGEGLSKAAIGDYLGERYVCVWGGGGVN